MKQRIKRLREELSCKGCDAFLVTRPENRMYLSGFSGTAGALVITMSRADLLTDFRYLEQAKRESGEHYQVLPAGGLLEDSLDCYFKEEGISSLGCEGDYLTYREFTALKCKLERINLKPLYGFVENLREIKDAAEIGIIRSAINIAEEAWRSFVSRLKPGQKERDAALDLEFEIRRRGAEGAAFNFIVASGPRGSLPHGVASERLMEEGDLVTVDFGCKYRGYHCDITRTVVLKRKKEDRQDEIYAIVLKALEAGISAVKEGVKAREVDAAARSVIESYGYGENFGHSTGHGVGLSVHEAPKLSAGDDTILKAGMVVTVEPGIYLPEWGGVRIEDMVLVEKGRGRLLTTVDRDKLMAV